MQWGWTADEAGARAVMDAFIEAGGNFLDTADVYSRWAEGNPGGVSEEIIGRWARDRANREQLVIATKVRGPMGDGPNASGLGRKHIMEAVEGSLRRLQTDYIDLYQAHALDAEIPIDETLRAFDDLIRQGKVRYVGASNYPAWRLSLALAASTVHGWARYDALQPHYNLVHRGEFERELRPLCEETGLGVIPYSPLAAGFLTGKYRRGGALPPSGRARDVRERYLDSDLAWDALTAASEIARSRGKTVSQVALGWLLTQTVVTAPIVGANTVEQLRENLGAADLRLASEEMASLDAASGGPFSWND
jgi:aryl-alcohol dehydrogenase-like predicted oxidoreductase